jgi:3-hydroxybutyryl-CoA dehydrogenase
MTRSQNDAQMTDAAQRIAVAVIGAGLMGSQIGCEYALAGHRVVFVARDVERARQRVGEAFATARRFAVAAPEALEHGSRRLRFRDDCAGDEPVELIVESLVEDRAVKAEWLAAAAAWRPQATLATNSSSIGVSELGALAGAGPRLLATHYWNPPLLMGLVEVLGSESTEPARVDRVCALLRAIGKRPVRLEREAPGMLWNRIQLAVLREALWLVEHGVASPAVIDEVMRDGLARRWRLTGPFETVSLGGAATFDAVAANLFPTLSDARETTGFGPHLIEDAQALAVLRERRDQGLATELARERGAPGD